MGKAKLINNLIVKYEFFIKNIDNKEVNANFLGFLEACKIILTEDQIMIAINEANKRCGLLK